MYKMGKFTSSLGNANLKNDIFKNQPIKIKSTDST